MSKLRPQNGQFNNVWRSAYTAPALLGLILCLAAAFRMHNIHLPGPYFDDVYFSNAAKHFLAQEPIGALKSITIAGTWFPLTFSPHTGTVTVYIEAAFMVLTRDLQHLDRYLNIAYALVAIVLAYALTAQLVGRRYALLGAWILAVLPAFVFWSRVGNHLIFFRSVIGAAFFYLMFRWLDTRENKNLYLMALVLGLGVSTRVEAGWLAVAFLTLALVDGECRTAVWTVVSNIRVLLICLVSGLLGGLLFVTNQLVNDFPILRQIARNAGVSLYGHENTAFGANLLQRTAHMADLFRGNLFPEYGPTYSNVLWPIVLLGSVIFLAYLALPNTAPKLATEKKTIRRLLVLSCSILVLSTYSPTGLSAKHMIFVIYLPLVMILLAARSIRHYSIPAFIPITILLIATGMDIVNTFKYHQNLARTGGLGRWSPIMYDLVEMIDQEFADYNIYIGNWGIGQQLDFFSRHKLQIKSIFGFEKGFRGTPKSFFRRINKALLSGEKCIFIFYGPLYEKGFIRRLAFLEHLWVLDVAYSVRYIRDKDGNDIFYLYVPDVKTIKPKNFSTSANPGSAQVVSEIPRVIRWGPRRTRSGTHFNLQKHGKSSIWMRTENATINTILVFDGVALPTTFGSSELLTAAIPPKLYAKEGRFELYLLEPSTGARSNVVQFVVDP